MYAAWYYLWCHACPSSPHGGNWVKNDSECISVSFAECNDSPGPLFFHLSLSSSSSLLSVRIKIRHAYHSSHLSIIIHCWNYILPHRCGSVEGRAGLPSCLPVDIQHLIFFSNREQTVQPPPVFSLYKNVCQELCARMRQYRLQRLLAHCLWIFMSPKILRICSDWWSSADVWSWFYNVWWCWIFITNGI